MGWVGLKSGLCGFKVLIECIYVPVLRICLWGPDLGKPDGEPQ